MFGLTMVFFVVSYFGITTSGEDIHQGANSAPAVLEDAQAAFRHNARIPDMYAWAVINFFDYQYSFGVDTVFRVIDVLLGVGMLYLMTMVVLGRKVRLELRDAVIWGLGFLMIFLTPHGRVLYAGFSAIHNYLGMLMITLAFSLPYLRRLRGEEIEDKWWRGIMMLLVGITFGLSSNLTPVAFGITAMGIMLVRMMRVKQVKAVWQKVRIWEVLGVVGILIGMGVAYVGGPGVSDYVNGGYATEYDYVSLETMAAEPGASLVRLVKHGMNNSARVLMPVVAVLLGCAVIRWVGLAMRRRGIGLKRARQNKVEQKQKGEITWWPQEEGDRRLLLALVGFVVVHIAVATQLNAPIRILLPAYVAAVMAMLMVIKSWLKEWKLEIAAVGLLLMVAIVVGVRAVLAMDYHERAGKVLERIRESEEAIVCVTREEVRSRQMPGIYLGQEEMLADWAMPERIYNKEVKWCK